MLFFTGAAGQLMAYEPYSQFHEFNATANGGVAAALPPGMMWVIENVSGRIIVPTGIHILNFTVFEQTPTGAVGTILYIQPTLTSSGANVGPQGKDVYLFDNATRAYHNIYSSPSPLTVSFATDSFQGLESNVSLSLTGYLIPLSTVWTGVTSLNPGEIKEVTISELQLAGALQSGYDYTSLPQFGGGRQVQAGGELRVGPAEQLRFTSTAPLPAVPGQNGPSTYTTANYNGGSIQALGNASSTSEIEFTGSLTNASSTGLITAHDAALRFTGGLDNRGAVSLTRGGNDVFGDITNRPGGNIVIAGGANVTFYDDITQNGTLQIAKFGSTTSVAVFLGAFTGSGGTTGGGDAYFAGDLRPGNSPASVTFGGSVGLAPSAATRIELGGGALGDEYDHITVNGHLSLGGTLAVSLVAGFTPTAGQSFDLLDWTTLTGSFSSLSLPALAGGLAWNTSQLYATGVLSVAAAGLPGDFDNNGTVDGFDFLRWQRGGSPNPLSAADLATWKANYGAGAAQASAASLPEPGSIVLVMVGTACTFGVRRRQPIPRRTSPPRNSSECAG